MTGTATLSARLAVVIVNYGAADFIIKNLDKTLREISAFNEAHIYIADNASPGDDLAILQAAIAELDWTNRVTAFATGGNLGFAGGNNAAFRQFGDAPPDYVLFLNPDAWLEPGALTQLAQTLTENPKAAIVAPRLLDEDGGDVVSYYNFPRINDQFGNEVELDFFQRRAGWQRLDFNEVPSPVEVEWVSGAAFLLRMSAAATPPMDEGYFLYFEETDMMRALSNKGWTILIDGRARVVHIGGLTTGADGSSDGAALPAHWYRSWARYFLKEHGRWGAALAAGLKTAGTLVYYLKCALRRHKPRRPQHYMRDFNQIVWPIIFRGKTD